jgi:hypothetical protein
MQMGNSSEAWVRIAMAGTFVGSMQRKCFKQIFASVEKALTSSSSPSTAFETKQSSTAFFALPSLFDHECPLALNRML